MLATDTRPDSVINCCPTPAPKERTMPDISPDQALRFFRCFVIDLLPHQDGATTAKELVESCREVVLWHLAHDPNDNGLFKDESEGRAFLAWFDDSEAQHFIYTLTAYVNASRHNPEGE